LFFVQSWVESHDSAQSGAPLQFNVQSPVQPVILHVWAPVHVRVQSFPVQSIVQSPPVQVCVQSPPGHCMEHAELAVQIWVQSPPAQVSEQLDCDPHSYWQSPLPGQLSVHWLSGAQVQAPPSHVKPARDRAASPPAPASVPIPELLLPLQPTISHQASPAAPAVIHFIARECTRFPWGGRAPSRC
jgi:hypothetical protein